MHILATCATSRACTQVDPDKLRRVTLNLLSNAFKFTPVGGTIRVTLREAAASLVLEVADDGPGVPLAQRALFVVELLLKGGWAAPSSAP